MTRIDSNCQLSSKQTIRDKQKRYFLRDSHRSKIRARSSSSSETNRLRSSKKINHQMKKVSRTKREMRFDRIRRKSYLSNDQLKKRDTTIRHRKMNNQAVSSIFCFTITSKTLKRSAFDEVASSAKRFALDTQQELTMNELINVEKNKLAVFFASIFIMIFMIIVFVFVSNFILTRHSKLRTFSSNSLCFLITIENQKFFESKTYKKVMICSNRNKWIEAMKNEHDFFMINKTWKLIDLSLNRKCLEDKWVFKFKRDFHEEILRYKTRWMIRDFEQRKSVNYHETYASMIKPMSYKIIFVIAVVRDWELEQMNIKTTFLYEDVNEEIYVKQFIELDVENSICRLNKVLYDLKQSSRIWYQILTFFLIKYDFKSLNANLNVFVKENLILVVYVNDLLIIDETMKTIIFEKKVFKKRFHMIDLKFCSYYLNMFVTRNRRNRILKLD